MCFSLLSLNILLTDNKVYYQHGYLNTCFLQFFSPFDINSSLCNERIEIFSYYNERLLDI
jgi:hypothetical protein